MSNRDEAPVLDASTTNTSDTEHDDLVHEILGGAEKVAHEVADSSVDALETAALLAMEASSQLQESYKRRPLLMLGVLGGLAAALLIGIAALTRRS